MDAKFGLTAEQREFRASVRSWVDFHFPKGKALQLEKREQTYPVELFEAIGQAGYYGVGIDETYGGSGGSVLDQTVLIRELARNLGGLAWIWGINAFAGAKSIGLYGTEDQKNRFLPDLAAGKLKFAIAVTEPDGGTDVLGAMTSTARRVPGGWRLDARKTWSTQSSVADYVLLLARTGPPEPKPYSGLTLFLVPGGAAGFSAVPIPKLGMRCLPSCEVFCDDVFAPDELVLGEPGQAWRQLTRTLNVERIILASLALGILDGVLEEATDYVKQRRAFGRPIGQFQILQHYLADIVIDQRATELLVWRAAALASDGLPCEVDANVAKVFAAERAVHAADVGIQIMGGLGYSADTHMQRYWRDARLYPLAPISNEMARNSIAEDLGLPRSF